MLTPLAVGPGRPFPYISNLSLSLGVFVRDPVSEVETFARVKVPKEVLPRFVPIGDETFVPLESVIARHLGELFPGMEILRHDFFRVTRDADFTVSDEADDLLRAVEDELRRRRFGEVVRLEVALDMDPDMRGYLIEQLAIEEAQVTDIDGLLDLDDLMALYEVDGHRELRDHALDARGAAGVRRHRRGRPRRARGDALGRPARAPPVRLVRRAASSASSSRRSHDPDVLAIKMTVYRTSDDSALIPALIEAAERGKQAVCLVELKARFDERRNIGWARSLEEAGAHVVHGLPGLKTHAKALLVVRREGPGVRHYVHIGTGNYHAKTARLYEDFGLFTCDRQIAADVAELFNSLTGAARTPEYRKRGRGARPHAEVVPRRGASGRSRRSAPASDARIVLKMNSLVDARCIRALYEASQAGVQVDLNVRGICCLRPGVPGISENITRGVGRGPLPRALAGLRVRARRRARVLDRLAGPDAAQPRHARRAARAGRGRVAPRGARRTRWSATWPTTPSAGSSPTDGDWTRRTGGTRVGAPRADGARARARARGGLASQLPLEREHAGGRVADALAERRLSRRAARSSRG